MTAAEIVRTRLLACDAVADIAGARIYNGNWPQAPTHPSIRVNDMPGGQEQYHFRGPVDVHRVTVQVDCCAPSLTAANALAAAVHGDGLGSDATGLSGFTGDVSGTQVDLIKSAEPGNQYLDQEFQKWVKFRHYEVQFRGVM